MRRVGTGKTSLLRAMGGLWPVARGTCAQAICTFDSFFVIDVCANECSRSSATPAGEIILPHRYRKDVIFLPQVPYMTYGSLREQLVYPLNDTASSVSDADVIRVLKLARLENVIETIDDFDNTYTVDWGKMLSPGEQQKMAFARLFYARPMFAGECCNISAPSAFARHISRRDVNILTPFFFLFSIVLDEATSSMDTDSENEMFKQCRLLNITCITVCHNEGLERYHQQRLSLEGRGSWTFSQIPESDDDDRGSGDGQNGGNSQGSTVGPSSGEEVNLRLPGDVEFDNRQMTDY
jgi:ATP-binding cassette subfamily D (ALD) protein 4